MNHVQARQTILAAWPSAVGGSPALPELQFAQAVANHESNYGAGWKGACAGANNWGAIQASMPPCGAGSCLYTDSSPHADGSQTRYDVCFKTYGSQAEGAADALRTLYVARGRGKVLAAARRGSIYDGAAAMYDTGYFQGMGSTREQRITGYAKALESGIKTIAAANGEPVAMTWAGSAVPKWVWPALLFAGGVASAAGVVYLVADDLFGLRQHNPIARPLDVRQRAKQRAAGAAWFHALRRELKFELGDQLVLGDFDWTEWFDRKPTSAFMNGVDEARMDWEI